MHGLWRSRTISIHTHILRRSGLVCCRDAETTNSLWRQKRETQQTEALQDRRKECARSPHGDVCAWRRLNVLTPHWRHDQQHLGTSSSWASWRLFQLKPDLQFPWAAGLVFNFSYFERGQLLQINGLVHFVQKRLNKHRGATGGARILFKCTLRDLQHHSL